MTKSATAGSIGISTVLVTVTLLGICRMAGGFDQEDEDDDGVAGGIVLLRFPLVGTSVHRVTFAANIADFLLSVLSFRCSMTSR